MSLLMEALKKAERAKQGQGEQPAAAPDNPIPPSEPQKPGIELSLQPQEQFIPATATGEQNETPPAIETAPMPELKLEIEPTPPGSARVEPTLAAPELPLAGPLAASPQSPASAQATTAKPESRPAATQRQSAGHAAKSQPSATRDERSISAAQQKARSVFSAKAPARSRAVLIGGAAAAIAVVFAGFGFYYWQLVSSSSTVMPTPLPQQAATPATPDAAASIATPGTAATDLAALPQNAVAPGTTEKSSQPPAAAVDSAPVIEHQPAKTIPAIQIRQVTTPSQLNPSLSKAYQAYQAGDTDAAQQQYQRVLQQDANNRDALLGMAAIAQSRKQAGQAASLYSRLLELDPADPEALAGLVSVQGQTDPVQSESRLKKILAQNPQAAAVHFALGNVYSQQSHWAEAQQAYFRAYSSAPGNADYAFNLAVSLDFLNQGKLALEYYQRALSLARSGPANFDKASASTRIKELQQPAGE